ncbi:hypothetical protein THAR02_00263 [Trichoderma harzianum]|uniref:Uncharacterized protein n=1 Tax=Trichoderma harzianum TaxID=5544 RepID=A0A0F9Y688_TRIHA|nr:hypothetical protein THAR02_00263 [Trichoderma harzianum]
MPFKRAGLIQAPASTARLCYGRQLSASSAVRWWPPTDAQAAGSPRNALRFFFFVPSNAKDSLPRRNSEAETLPGAMTLAESRRSPPRWPFGIFTLSHAHAHAHAHAHTQHSSIIFLTTNSNATYYYIFLIHQPHAPPSKMIAASSEICNFGRGAYDTTGLPKPPPPQPQ